MKRNENIHPHKNLCTNVYSTFFIIAKTWNQPTGPSVGKWINCGTSREQNIIYHYKEMNHQAIKRHEETLNAYYCMEEASLKRLHTV